VLSFVQAEGTDENCSPGLGIATPQETISPELSATGLSVASKAESALGRDAVVVIVFIRCPVHE
jgi:hypothetical protein